MSNHAHRRRRRERIPRIRWAGFVDPADVAERSSGCDCPLIVHGHDPVVVEHHHRHGCPTLRDLDR